MQTDIIDKYLSQKNYENSETKGFFRAKMVGKALLSNHTCFKDVDRFIKIKKMWQKHDFW